MNSLLPAKPMMTKIRYPQLTGLQAISALWFPADWYDAEQRLTLILQHWRSNGKIVRFPQGDILCFAHSLQLYCESTVAWPLLRIGRTYCSAHLTPAEIATLMPADLWLVRNGQVEAIHFSQGELISLGDWIDISAYNLVETYSCYHADKVSEKQLLAPPQDVRALLGDKVPPASIEQQKFMQAAKEKIQSGSDTDMSISWFSHLKTWLIHRLISQKTADALQQSDQQYGLAQVPIWQRWLAKLVMTTGLSSLMGKQHANYIRRMMEMFESGDIDNALRHAISLGKESESLTQQLGRLSSRQNLTVKGSHSGYSPAVNIGADLEYYLRQLYRQQFTRLDQLGRIDEALFVLAELLQVRQEALDYLEKHHRYQQAAELARSWNFPAAQTIRLYCLNNDWQSAIAMARLKNAFADAVLILQSGYPDSAKQLRRSWAQTLAEKSEWLEAVDAIWPLVNERQQAREWLLNAESAGGQLAARALVKRALLLPDTFEVYYDYLTQLIQKPERYLERAILATELICIQQHTDATQNMIKMLVRVILAEQFSQYAQLTSSQIKRLIELSGDTLLIADLPKGQLPTRVFHSFDQQQECIEVEAPQAGLHHIYDAVVLEASRYLVALGEAGAAIVGPTGSIIQRFAVPAYRIVLSYSRQVALLLTPRDDIWRVSKVDLTLHRVVELGNIKMDVYAEQFDGVIWSIGKDRHLRVIDVENQMGTLWQIDDLPGQLTTISTTKDLERLIVREPEPSYWCYALPERRLIYRDNIYVSSDTIWQGLAPEHYLVSGEINASEHGRLALTLSFCNHDLKGQNRNSPRVEQVQLPEGINAEECDKLQIKLNNSLMLIFPANEQGQKINLYKMENWSQSLSIYWPNQTTPEIRTLTDGWLLFDQQGRLLHIDWNNSGIHHLSVG